MGALAMRGTKWLAACVLPALLGCGTWRDRAPGDSRGAWRAVREQHPAHKFTAEFESGFHDGYAECTTCGGGARPPAIPPAQFLRDRKYLSAAGHGLVNDYYSGFRYGTEVAAANGQGLSVPANYTPAPVVPYVPARAPVPAPQPATQRVVEAKPNEVPGHNKFDHPLEPRAVAASEPKGEPERPKLPKPEVPVIPPFNPDLSKFSTVAVPDADRLPIPVPALPVIPERPLPLPTPDVAPLAVPVPSLKVPASAPSAPTIHTDIPPIPFKH
jgi:hypothetical protein